MTVNALVPQVTYVYAGPGNYSFNFDIFEDTDIVVKHVDTLGVSTTLTLGVQYSISLTGPAPSAGKPQSG